MQLKAWNFLFNNTQKTSISTKVEIMVSLEFSDADNMEWSTLADRKLSSAAEVLSLHLNTSNRTQNKKGKRRKLLGKLYLYLYVSYL